VFVVGIANLDGSLEVKAQQDVQAVKQNTGIRNAQKRNHPNLKSPFREEGERRLIIKDS
jgi:hypothetical protein